MQREAGETEAETIEGLTEPVQVIGVMKVLWL